MEERPRQTDGQTHGQTNSPSDRAAQTAGLAQDLTRRDSSPSSLDSKDAGHNKGAGEAPARNGDWLHWLFDASLAAKALFDGLEALAGLTLLALGGGKLTHWAQTLGSWYLSRHPQDFLARGFEHWTSSFSGSSQNFYGIYLLTHGLLKVALVVALARGIKWAYPASIIVLGLFVLYQIHRFAFDHSPMMLALSALDLLVIALTWREWRIARGL